MRVMTIPQPCPSALLDTEDITDALLTIMIMGSHMDGLQAFMTMLLGTSNAT
jgi:hypothetical protein